MTDSPKFADVFADDLSNDTEARPSDVSALEPDQVFANDGETVVGSYADSGQRTPRFDGDTSELPAEVCWTLQELVAAPHVTEDSKRHWPVVLQYQDMLRSRLSELGLSLLVSEEHGYAFTRQAGEVSPHSRVVLRTKTLSLAASALVLYLYQQYLLAPDDPIVERADMIDHMLAYKPANDSDEVAFRKKIDTAISHLQPEIIKPVRGKPDRFVVYPVITAIVTAEQVTALQERYLSVVRSENSQASNEEVAEGSE